MDVLLLFLRLLLAGLLYAFLGAVLLLLWRDLRRANEVRERPAARLVVLASADGALSPATAFPLQPVTSLGRSPTNTIPLPDPHVSAQHALLVWRQGRWWLEDRGSRNGTRLNGTRIETPVVLSAGDVIGMGQVELKLEIG